MTPRNKILFPSIGLFTISLIVQLFSTNWTDNSSKTSLYILIIGIVGSISSMFIPNSSTLNIENNDWSIDGQNGYKIIISSKKHGLGNSPHTQVFRSVEDGYEEIYVETSHDKYGNVTIGATSTFNGKIKIT
ncbi:hypothetical protein [Flavobacterium sp. XS1P27]|uniref:hypothetical protein n=1 Tax=Flavobacterium sp. XS1P27 TaxID=3401724 RepID=UPI003AB00F6A